MSEIDDAEGQLLDMVNALDKRRATTSDPAEKQALAGQIEKINKALNHLAVVDSRGAAALINQASAEVETLLRTAQINPFDAAIRHTFQPLVDKVVAAATEASKAFATDLFIARGQAEPRPALDFAAAPPAAPAPAAPLAAPAPAAPLAAPAPAARQALPPIVVGSKLAQLTQDYTLCWATCQVMDIRRPDVEKSADVLIKGESRYRAVSARTNHVPWQLIGIIHGLECGYDFFKHLHNGDSLAAPTHHEPPGRPPGWDGSRSWEDSAVDAITFEKLNVVVNWTLPAVLYALEGFNGFGYRSHNVRSPYLWSCSNLYTKGKFIADHDFNDTAVSRQVGAAVILKVLEQRGKWP
jgi:lysozyme family protein